MTYLRRFLLRIIMKQRNNLRIAILHTCIDTHVNIVICSSITVSPTIILLFWKKPF